MRKKNPGKLTSETICPSSPNKKYHVGIIYAREKCLDTYKEIKTLKFLLNNNGFLNVKTNAHT
jgi:hypothetical protein